MENGPKIVLAPKMAKGDNAIIEIHKNLDGGATLSIRDAKHRNGYPVRLTPDAAIGIALTLMETVGVPIQAALAMKAAGGKP